ncbi:MAG: hypothetical protein OXC84_03165 [Gammaproteobacteria bacterium]|nr:hypothetical protein [Gammaproteobacteria bacterium]
MLTSGDKKPLWGSGRCPQGNRGDPAHGEGRVVPAGGGTASDEVAAATHVEPRKRCTTPPHLSADVQRLGAADDRETAEGYRFERLALYTESAYAFISVDPDKQEAWFKLYGGQTLRSMPAAVRTTSLTHSLAKTRLV